MFRWGVLSTAKIAREHLWPAIAEADTSASVEVRRNVFMPATLRASGSAVNQFGMSDAPAGSTNDRYPPHARSPEASAHFT